MKLLASSYSPKVPTVFEVGLLRRIALLTKAKGQPPSLVEMATDRQNLERLRVKGWANWNPEQPRSLHVTEAGQKWLTGGES